MGRNMQSPCCWYRSDSLVPCLPPDIVLPRGAWTKVKTDRYHLLGENKPRYLLAAGLQTFVRSFIHAFTQTCRYRMRTTRVMCTFTFVHENVSKWNAAVYLWWPDGTYRVLGISICQNTKVFRKYTGLLSGLRWGLSWSLFFSFGVR